MRTSMEVPFFSAQTISQLFSLLFDGNKIKWEMCMCVEIDDIMCNSRFYFPNLIQEYGADLFGIRIEMRLQLNEIIDH